MGGDFWDDDLSEQELDLICGVYKVFTGQYSFSYFQADFLNIFLGKGSPADNSWWPKANVWKNSGLNVGYWSPACGHFYQKRLEKIIRGEADLKNSSDWRSALKNRKQTRLLISANEKFASQLISGT
jgi:hypothetical protein